MVYLLDFILCLGILLQTRCTFHDFTFEDLPETISYLKFIIMGYEMSDNKTIFNFKCAINAILKEIMIMVSCSFVLF